MGISGGDIDDSLQFIKNHLKKDPKDTRALVCQANLLFEKNEPDKALESIERAIEIDQEYGDLYFHKARALFMKNDSNSALVLLGKLLKLDSGEDIITIKEGKMTHENPSRGGAMSRMSKITKWETQKIGLKGAIQLDQNHPFYVLQYATMILIYQKRNMDAIVTCPNHNPDAVTLLLQHIAARALSESVLKNALAKNKKLVEKILNN